MPPVEDEELSDPLLDTEDFRAFSAARDGDTTPAEEKEASAVDEEETPPSEPADEAGQIAEESEPTDKDAEQEALEAEVAELEALQETLKPAKGKPGDNRLAKRMRDLTGEIAALKSRLDEREKPADVEVEEPVEVASTPAVAAVAAEDAVAPMLKDFEDDEASGKSAWDLYEIAIKAFNKSEMAKAIAAALDAQRTDLTQKQAAKDAKAAEDLAQADWNKAASRFPNFNEKATEKIQISTAMQRVMRMDPEAGTELVMYFGDHPEEAKAIALDTLAANDAEWPLALARAGMKLGEIRARLSPVKLAIVPKAAPGAPVPPTVTKKVTSASRPPTQIRGGAATPKFDTANEADAADVGKWMKQRERELAASGKR